MSAMAVPRNDVVHQASIYVANNVTRDDSSASVESGTSSSMMSLHRGGSGNSSGNIARFQSGHIAAGGQNAATAGTAANHPKRGTSVCRHWARGYCNRGNACGFVHAPGYPQQGGNPTSADMGRRPCKEYAATGQCRRGRTCVFGHDTPPQPLTPQTPVMAATPNGSAASSFNGSFSGMPMSPQGAAQPRVAGAPMTYPASPTHQPYHTAISNNPYAYDGSQGDMQYAPQQGYGVPPHVQNGGGMGMQHGGGMGMNGSFNGMPPQQQHMPPQPMSPQHQQHPHMAAAAHPMAQQAPPQQVNNYYSPQHPYGQAPPQPMSPMEHYAAPMASSPPAVMQHCPYG